jgi:hypothetical protein
MLAAVAVAAVAVTGVVLVLNFVPEETTEPTGPQTSSGNPPVSSSQGISTSPGVPTLGATATAAAPAENLRAGDGCGWQLEGDRRTGVDGVALVCTLADGTYQWRPPG